MNGDLAPANAAQSRRGGPRPASATSFFLWANFLFTVGVTGGDLGVAPGNVQDNSTAAFAGLVNWVTNAVKPAGDDILTPAAVADPKFGCQFSVPGHPGLPGCP